MKTLNKELDEALAFDPLDEAEKRTGLSYKENESVIGLGIALMQKNNQTKDSLLLLNNDTRLNASLRENLDAIEHMGFKLCCIGDIPDTKNKWRMFWDKGVLLFCDSYYDDTSLNSGNAYFNYRGPYCLDGCSHSSDGKVFFGSYDIREGLRHKLDTMRANGELLETWVKRPWLWLLHYNDSKVEGYDHSKITEHRISLLPKEVQLAIGKPKP